MHLSGIMGNEVCSLIDFVSIDFETANASRDSACALGAVVVRNNIIVERRYSLINPTVPFQRFCTYIHGITEQAVETMPTFLELHPSIFSLLNGRTVVAHNASFDMAVLKASCESRSLDFPSCSWYCSVEMARKAWPEFPHHRLNALCEEFDLNLKHHNAIEDATACALLVLICARQFGADSIDELKSILFQKNLLDSTARKNAQEECR